MTHHRLFHGKIIEQRMRRPTYAYAYIPGEKSSARKDTKINEERRSVLEYRNTLYTLSERDTGPFSRRTGIIISSAPCRDRYDEHGPVKGARGEATMKRTSAAASQRKEDGDRRQRKVEIYVTGESASIACCKRAGSCPAPGYTVPVINMRLTEWDRCFSCYTVPSYYVTSIEKRS